MSMERLERELKEIGINKELVNLGNKPSFAECYNIIRQQDGKWEVFFGERGQKMELCVCENEDEAVDALLKLIIRCSGIKTTVRQPFFTRWRQHKSDNDQ